MEKRYQVFVSSTFQDLQDERQEVIQALLELDCIPAGMELFPAANDDQWSLIKKVIDDCDYYIVIIGGRYGSIGPNGISYTEMEYRYALDRSKPIIAFLHKDTGILPVNRCESTPDGKAKLENFRTFVQQKMCRFWDSPVELGSQVSRSLIKLIKNNPAIGWVRADLVPDQSASDEILRLKKRIEELEASLAATGTQAPEGTQDLAQGNDEFQITFALTVSASGMPFDETEVHFSLKFLTSWNNIFSYIAPLMIDEASDDQLRAGINNYIRAVKNIEHIRRSKECKDKEFFDFRIVDLDFQTIKIQLRALGLISKSAKQRSVKDTSTYWTLTPYGDSVMTRLRAIRKDYQ